ncbi:hypothetical protein J1N35_037606 [Gossypium stocksii]|uniref:Uncharacterized protein n=1 Tax=Gossypium stocksii TaxID=47602 RepID=A0A9D3UKE6_9ROSI|nr:hypothetical protein J1N35_037606 [Gossypium stocksii]
MSGNQLLGEKRKIRKACRIWNFERRIKGQECQHFGQHVPTVICCFSILGFMKISGEGVKEMMDRRLKLKLLQSFQKSGEGLKEMEFLIAVFFVAAVAAAEEEEKEEEPTQQQQQKNKATSPTWQVNLPHQLVNLPRQQSR